jgi:GT2 family glycosyltransferase
MPLPSVAVVILNWNGKKFLEQFLPSVMASSYTNLKVVVADNASTDDSVLFLSKHYPEVDLIQLDKNYGFAGGYNLALKQVVAEYYVLLNSDVEVTKDWIAPVIETMEANKTIAACQPKILSFHQRTHFEYAGACGGWIDAFGYPFARGRVMEDCEKDEGQYDLPIHCFWASGAALFVRSELFHQVSGFDASFFAHQEEIELCWRFQLMGFDIACVPRSVVYHVGGGTLPKGNSMKVLLNFRNNLVMMARYLPIQQLIWKLPIRFFLDALAAWRSLFRGDVGFFFAVAKAHFAAVFRMAKGSDRRMNNRSKSRDLKGYLNRSMIWDYYVRKKKKFSALIVDK